MITHCPPTLPRATANTLHHLTHKLYHASHHVVRHASGVAHHASKAAIGPHLAVGAACKMGAAAIVAGALLTGPPTSKPHSSDRMTSTGDGASRSSTTTSENSGSPDQASSRIWFVGLGSALTVPAVAPGGQTTNQTGGSLAFSNPFGPGSSSFPGSEVARDLRPVLNELPADMAPAVTIGDPDAPRTVSLATAQVDEPSSDSFYSRR